MARFALVCGVAVLLMVLVSSQPPNATLSWLCRPGLEFEDLDLHCPAEGQSKMPTSVSVGLGFDVVQAMFKFSTPLSGELTGACLFSTLENAQPLFVGQDYLSSGKLRLAVGGSPGENDMTVNVVFFRGFQIMHCTEIRTGPLGDGHTFVPVPSDLDPHDEKSLLRARDLIAEAQLPRSVFRYNQFASKNMERAYLDVLMGAILDDFNFAQGKLQKDGSVDGLMGTSDMAFGNHWPARAKTMVGRARMRHVEHCVRGVVADNIPGDFLETGVWRGGACVFMRGVLHALGVTDRTVWVADSFEGLPKPDEETYPADKGCEHHTFSAALGVSLEEVQSNFITFGLADDRVKFIKGFFETTMAQTRAEGLIKNLAILRLDGDMYSSTITVLDNMYDYVPDGGFIIVDDYGTHLQARSAIKDFWETRNITGTIWAIDTSSAYWRKNSEYTPPKFGPGHYSYFPTHGHKSLQDMRKLVSTPVWER